ncbi:hypothetical protein RLOatenuis_6670 [Rickettsiales bacterium]|nr:hypothetical protein RLOatenuis_6670 [Rickettsiales bacterium]
MARNNKHDNQDNADSNARYLDLKIRDKKEDEKALQDKIEDISDVQEASHRDGYSAEQSRDRLNLWNNRREAKLRKLKESKRSKFFNNFKILARNLLATIKRTNNVLLWPSTKIKKNFIWIKRAVQKEREKLLDKQREINRLAVARNRSLQQRHSDLSQQRRLLSKITLAIQPILLMLRKPPSMQHTQISHLSSASSLRTDTIYPQKLQMSTKYKASEQQTTNDNKLSNITEKKGTASAQEFNKDQNFYGNIHENRENRVSFLFPPQPMSVGKANLGINTSLKIKFDAPPILMKTTPTPSTNTIEAITVRVVVVHNIRQPGVLVSSASQSVSITRNLPAQGPDIAAR